MKRDYKKKKKENPKNLLTINENRNKKAWRIKYSHYISGKRVRETVSNLLLESE